MDRQHSKSYASFECCRAVTGFAAATAAIIVFVAAVFVVVDLN